VAVQPELPGDASQSNPAGEPFGRLWAFLSSPVCAALLLTLTAVLLVLSALFPQFSPVIFDPAARERWLAEAAARWGTLGPTLRTLGVFQMERSLLWKVCLGLGVLTLLVRLEVSARRAWGFSRADLSRMDVCFREETTTADTAEQVCGRLRGRLEEQGFRVRVADNGGLAQLHAVTQPWASALRPICCLGSLLIVASLLLSGAAAQWEQVPLGPGESVALSLRTGWSALLRDFTEEPGISARFRGRIALFGPEADLLAEGIIATERPLWANGLTLHMSGTGPGLRAEAIGASGQPMMLQPASGAAQTQSLFLRFDEDQPEQYFAVPETEDTVRVVLHPGSGDGSREFLVQVYHGAEAQPRAERLLSGTASLEVDGVTYRFAATRYPTLIAASNPAKWLLWAGAVLVILAALLMRFFSPRGILVRVAESGGKTDLELLAEDPEGMDVARRAASEAAQTEGTP